MATEIQTLTNSLLTSFTDQHQLNESILIVDIREPSEYAQEHIPNSLNIPLNKLDSTDFSNIKQEKALFYCKLGNRTRTGQKILLNTHFKEIYALEGGIEQWKQCGLPTKINPNAPIDVMRQVQIIAGTLVLLGIIFSYILTPAFILLSAFVALGLLVAGITGFCGMAKLLMLLPWNK